MRETIEQRACDLAVYIIENKATVRAAAKQFGISKSTVHKDLSERLPHCNRTLYLQVKQVLEQNKVNGALACAQSGYEPLFSQWLPYYSSLNTDPYRLHKTLLLIMSMLDDTNVGYRKGTDEMKQVKAEARELLNDFSLAKLSKMNSDFTARNISPGGCADMLSLTIFIHSLTNENSI